MTAYATLDELRRAQRGEVPAARLCADRVELAFWFYLVSLALSMTSRVELDARRGRILEYVRR